MNNNNLKIIIVNSTLFKMNNEYILTFITYKWIKVFITCTHLVLNYKHDISQYFDLISNQLDQFFIPNYS